MSIVFSDTANKNGIIQLCERYCGFNDGDISGNPTLLAKFTGDINLALDEVLGFMFPLGGTWQLDDLNHVDYPFIQTNIISGQRDYAFTTDGSGNVILDIYRVMVADANGTFREILPVDQNTANSNEQNTDSFINGKNASGVPTRYDKNANAIFLDLIPNYNLAGGLKVFINREPVYFTVADTSKKPGFAHLFHEYFALRPSYRYARDNTLANAKGLQNDMLMMKKSIEDYYGMREKDKKGGLRANVERTR